MAGTKKVLIVDDEPDSRDFVSAALGELEAVTTDSAGDGVSGLDQARASLPDLIVLDVQMPGMDGFEMFSQLKKDVATRSIPVVMLTGVREKTGVGFSGKDMGEFYGAAPDGYIEKPVDPEELQRTVAKLLGL